MAGPETYTLYKAPPAWGLPSSSAACIQVEAYLRLARVGFAVQCAGVAGSPTGQLPALDASDALVGYHAGSALPEDFQAANAIVASLNTRGLLKDGSLSAPEKADLLAYTVLLSSLQKAVLYTTYREAEAFCKHTRGVLGKELAFPLNYLLPQIACKDIGSQLADASAAEIYEGALEALSAISNRLRSSEGPFFFGSEATSLDAQLFGCLVYLKGAPVVHPELQKKLEGPALAAYVDYISSEFFASPAPSAALDADMQWSQWKAASGHPDTRGEGKAKSEKELELQRKGRIWLLVAAGAIAAYIVLGGQYVSITEFIDDDFEEEDE